MFLVTGGGGFIGSHLVDRLVQEGYRVRVLDNFSTGRWENLVHLAGDPRVQVVEGDICDPKILDRAMDGVDYVLHQAAIPSVPRSVEDPWSSHRVNAEGTLRVLMASQVAGVKRFVFASSSSVYGDSQTGDSGTKPKKENLVPAPLSPYAATKLSAEGYCLAFHQSYGLDTVTLRYFNVFGPRQNPTSQYASVVPRFAEALLKGERPVIYGDGRQTRDFTYVENVVDANLLACFSEGAAGGVFNVACGRSVSVLRLLQTMAKALKVETIPEFLPRRPGDVKHSRADISLIRKVLGYEPGVSFHEGILKTLEALR